MRIIHYIVTYNNNSMLERCLRSIFLTNTTHDRIVCVINNHSNLSIPMDLKDSIKIMDNQTRPDFSTGHLSRNWNQALINGFVNLNSPCADLIICSQNDTEFAPNYLEQMVDLHKNMDLITYGAGDNCVSYTSRAVKRVGLWDERFCNIGYQEADYFLRAAKYLNEKASINDVQHHRLHNPISTENIVKKTISGSDRRDQNHIFSSVHHKQSKLMFHTKWDINPEHWKDDYLNTKEKIQSFILYPYFENAVETLIEQNFLVAK